MYSDILIEYPVVTYRKCEVNPKSIEPVKTLEDFEDFYEYPIISYKLVDETNEIFASKI